MTEQVASLPSPGRYRWRVPLVLGITVIIAYLDRINITLALPLIAEQFQWSEAELQRNGGLLMSMFYVGYGLSGLLLSPFAATLGPRRGVVTILVLASLFTAMGAYLSQFLLLFAASRVLLGVAEGPHFPLGGMAVRHWFPPGERSRANSLLFAGVFVAVISGPLLLVPLMHGFGWRAAFLVLAIAGLGFSVPLVLRFVRDTPGDDPHIPAPERSWLEAHIEPGGDSGPAMRYPLYLFRNKDFLLLLSVGTLSNLVTIGLTSWIPTYLTHNLGVPYEQLTWLASLPYLSGLLGLAFWAHVGDRSNRRGLVAAAGFLVLSGLIYVAFTSEVVAVTISTMVLAVFCASAYTSSEYAFAQRIIPARHIAAGIGLFNGISIVAGGSLAPILASGLLQEDGGYSLMLLVLLAIATAALMAILGRRQAY